MRAWLHLEILNNFALYFFYIFSHFSKSSYKRDIFISLEIGHYRFEKNVYFFVDSENVIFIEPMHTKQVFGCNIFSQKNYRLCKLLDQLSGETAH